MTCRPVARLKRMPRTKGFGNRIAARSRSAYERRKARTSSCEVLKLLKSVSERWRRARFDTPRRLHSEACLDWRFHRPHEPAPDQPGGRRAPPESALLSCADCWLLHCLQIHAVRVGQMVEAFRHAPRAGFGVPPASIFGKTCNKRLRIALGCVELVLQVLDVRCACVHAPYCRIRRRGLSPPCTPG